MSCGSNVNGEKNNSEPQTQAPTQSSSQQAPEATLKTYNITVDKGNKLGKITAVPKTTENDMTLYEISVSANAGYEVKSFKLNGTEYELSDNKIECLLSGDASLSVEYKRKNSEELTKRQDAVIDKMLQYTTTLFKYDKDYSYTLRGKTVTLQAGVLHGGLPYTAYASTSPDAFLDFAVTKDEFGVYTISFPYGNDPLYWGGSCGNAVFWAWGSVSSTIKFSYSSDMIEKNGAIPVGDWSFDPVRDIKNGIWDNTQKICFDNGTEKMLESYAMLSRGDAVTYQSPNGNHVMIVSEINVVRKSNGSVNANESYVICMDQNGGYSYKQTPDGLAYWSSCSYNAKKTFASLFAEGYLPVTCIELLDDSQPLAKAEVRDSLTKETFSADDVYSGYIESNYAITKVETVIKDSNGNIVYEGRRHTEENRPQKFDFLYFSTKNLDQMNGVYNDVLSVRLLEKGTYSLIVTAYLSNGESIVVRNKTFTK